MSNISYICSKYHKWFRELGYPQLDINQYSDGSWDIIEYYNSPVIPCLTKYRTILGNMKNIEISFGFCKKYIEEIDLQKKAIWEREERKTSRMEQEKKSLDDHRQEYADKAFEAVRKNPDLMDRIAKNGLEEMNLGNIAQHIPYSELKAMNKVMLAK